MGIVENEVGAGSLIVLIKSRKSGFILQARESY